MSIYPFRSFATLSPVGCISCLKPPCHHRNLEIRVSLKVTGIEYRALH